MHFANTADEFAFEIDAILSGLLSVDELKVKKLVSLYSYRKRTEK